MSTDPDHQQRAARTAQAAHALQSGVAAEHGIGGQDGTAKHLRVGINMALCQIAGIHRVLVAKGIATDAEIDEAYLTELEAEVARYEQRLSQHYGRPVKLA